MLANDIAASITKVNSIVLLPHINMDGDSFGSALAMYLALKKMGKDVTVLVEEEPQCILQFLPGSGEFCLFDGEKESIEKFRFDLAIAIDTGDIERLGSRVVVFNNAKETINIDHHPSNTNFASINYVEPTASATGEIIYTLLKSMETEFDIQISTCLYTAIASDTGGFRFANTSALTHQIAGELINFGAPSSEICTNLFENISIGRLRILSEVANALELHNDGKLSVIVLTEKMLKETGATDEDVSGMSNLGRSINGVEVSIFIKEKPDKSLRVSMRGRDSVDLSLIAQKYGGGGHKRAAGFDGKGSIEELKETLIKEFVDIL